MESGKISGKGIGAGEVPGSMDLFLREGEFQMVSGRKDGDCSFCSYMRDVGRVRRGRI